MGFITAGRISAFIAKVVCCAYVLRHAVDPLFLNLSQFAIIFLLATSLPAAAFASVVFKVDWADFEKLLFLHCLMAIPGIGLGITLLHSGEITLLATNSLQQIGECLFFSASLVTMAVYGFNLIWCEIKKDALRLIGAA